MFLEIGESGWQQIKYGAMLCLLKMYHPLHTLQYTFVARQTGFQCHVGDGQSGVSVNSSCVEGIRASCASIEYTEDTIISEWDLVCDQNWWSKATMSALMFGFLLGSLFLGMLADKIGRKRNMMMCFIGMLVFNTVSATTTEFSVYLLSRFVVGIFLAGNILSLMVLLTELVGPAYRGIYSLALTLFFSSGIALLSLLASHWPHSWRGLTHMVTLLGLPFLVLQWWMVESPRWLLSVNRTEEAEVVLRKIARGNGVTGKLDITLRAPPGHKTSPGNIGDSVTMLFTSPRLLGVTLILCFCWFVVGGSYYGLTLAAGHMGTDVYTGTALSGLVEIPSVIFIYYAIECHGRRAGVVGFLTLSGLFCLGIRFMPSLTAVLALLGKLCIAGAFTVVYIISGEVFATSIRNSALGVVSAIARVGAIVAPFIVMLGETSPGLQFFIFGLFCVLGGLLGFGLPETRNKPLPESVREMLVDKEKKIETLHV